MYPKVYIRRGIMEHTGGEQHDNMGYPTGRQVILSVHTIYETPGFHIWTYASVFQLEAPSKSLEGLS